jgi:hypothetical protein
MFSYKEHVMERSYTFVRRKMESFAHDRTDWKAAIWAGVIAAIIFMAVQMLMAITVMGQSPWVPPRMIAAMAMGREVLPPPATFDIGIMMSAMMIHFPLSIVYGLLLGWIVHRLSGINAFSAGGIFGLAIYFINFYLIAPIMFPWFAEMQNGVSVTSHVIYGATLGGAYVGMRHHKPEKQ